MSETLAGGMPAQAAVPGYVGASPWALARRRLRRNKTALAMLGVLALIVLLSLAAPLYARLRRAHRPVPLQPRRHDRRGRQDGSRHAAGDQKGSGSA